MKNILLIIALFLNASFQILAQKQKVPYFLKERKSIEFYKQQRTLWEEETKSKPKSEEAWLYLFTATRALNLFNRDPQWEKKQEVIIVEMEKKIPNTFTFNYCKGWYLGNGNPKAIKYIEQAYKLNPENPLTYKELIVQYEVALSDQKRKHINQIWYNSGDFSPGLLNFSTNVLNGLEQSAVIITLGDHDTYPIWMLQDVKGLRQDVVVCNISMMRLKEYREKLFAAKGLVFPEEESKAFADEFEKGFERKWSEQESNDWNIRLTKAIHKHNPEKPLYVALAENVKPLEDQLYLIGLSSKYSDKKFDNLAVMKKNYEKTYLLDYLKMSFQPDPTQTFVDDCNQYYVPSFLKLYRHYKDSGENEKAIEIKLYIEILAKNSPNEKDILNLLN